MALETIEWESLIISELEELCEQAPLGVYALPDKHDLKRWQGAVFVDEGLYIHGCFRFVIALSESYPNKCPVVTFSSPMFHPLVSGKTGELSPAWLWLDSTSTEDHYRIQTILQKIKDLFTRQDLWGDKAIMNQDAWKLY